MVPSKGAWSTLTFIDKDTYRRKRKIFPDMLSDKALQDFDPTMIEHVSALCIKPVDDIKPNRFSKPANMVQVCKYCASIENSTTSSQGQANEYPLMSWVTSDLARSWG